MMEPISAITCPSLTPNQIEDLQAAGIKSLIDLISAPKEAVCKSMKCCETDFYILRKTILRYRQPHPVRLTQLVTPETMKFVSSGINGLDKVLNGGLRAGNIIEFYGKTGCGKTQICLQWTSRFCHSAFAEHPSTVLYFDVKNDFNASRLLQFCGGNDQSLNNVRVFRVPNFEGLLMVLDQIKSEVIDGISGVYSRCKLIVIDSVPMIIYPVVEIGARRCWRPQQEKLLTKLRWLADTLQLSVVLVNHAVTSRANISADSKSETGTNAALRTSTIITKPAMGKYWQYKINLRIHLVKLSNNYYKGILEKSSEAAAGQEFRFSIGKDKIEDIAIQEDPEVKCKSKNLETTVLGTQESTPSPLDNTWSNSFPFQEDYITNHPPPINE